MQMHVYMLGYPHGPSNPYHHHSQSVSMPMNTSYWNITIQVTQRHQIHVIRISTVHLLDMMILLNLMCFMLYLLVKVNLICRPRSSSTTTIAGNSTSTRSTNFSASLSSHIFYSKSNTESIYICICRSPKLYYSTDSASVVVS